MTEIEQKEFLIKYIDEMVKKVKDSTNQIQMTQKNLVSSPYSAGVYGVYDKGVLIYVGETKCLAKRMSQIFKTRNHTFRRSLGKQLFADCEDYTKASTRNGFCERIEDELNAYIATNLTVFLLPVSIGRKEIEERIVETSAGSLNN